MATRRVINSLPVDTGCQFLSIDQDPIYDFFVRLAPTDAVRELPQSILCLPEGFIVDNSQRYYLEGGMTRWSKNVVAKLETMGNFHLHFEHPIESPSELERAGFQSIIVTAPGPEGRALGATRAVEYHPCLSLIFTWHKAPREALQHYAYRDISSREGITWLGHEGLKCGRPGLWLAQLSPAASIAWSEGKHTPDELEDMIQVDLSAWIPLFGEGEKTYIDKKFWKNAFPLNFDEPNEHPAFERVDRESGTRVYYIGDGYKGVGRTENAIESAFAVVEDLLNTAEEGAKL
jgi:predicted NAD/FAD-dependent oxidoreductase